MSRLPIIAAILLSLGIAFAPAVADARAGSSSSRGSAGVSQGSMGSRTYTPSQAAPVQRSITPQATTPAPAGRPGFNQPGMAGGGFGSGFFGGGFMSGLMGGLIGAGIGHMLFGGGGLGMGGLGAGGMLGSLLHLAFWGLIIYVGYRLIRRMMSGGGGSRPAYDTAGYRGGMDNGYAREQQQGGYSPFGGGTSGGAAAGSAAGSYAGAAYGGAPASSDLQITDDDYNSFSRLLTEIQGAWSRGDLNALRRYMTPEMLGYFSEELSRNTSDGVENRVEDVQFQNGAVVQAWREGDVDYATAKMDWTARDYLVRNDRNPGDRDYVAKGDPNQPVEASEAWTFMRHHGGNWVLSAIQQV